jgi:hypothetical protein
MTMNLKTTCAFMLANVVLLMWTVFFVLCLYHGLTAAIEQGLIGVYGGPVNGGFWVGHLGVELWGTPGTFDGTADY